MKLKVKFQNKREQYLTRTKHLEERNNTNMYIRTKACSKTVPIRVNVILLNITYNLIYLHVSIFFLVVYCQYSHIYTHIHTYMYICVYMYNNIYTYAIHVLLFGYRIFVPFVNKLKVIADLEFLKYQSEASSFELGA